MLSIEIVLDFTVTINMNLTNKPCFRPLCSILTCTSIPSQDPGGSTKFVLISELKKPQNHWVNATCSPGYQSNDLMITRGLGIRKLLYQQIALCVTYVYKLS